MYHQKTHTKNIYMYNYGAEIFQRTFYVILAVRWEVITLLKFMLENRFVLSNWDLCCHQIVHSFLLGKKMNKKRITQANSLSCITIMIFYRQKYWVMSTFVSLWYNDSKFCALCNKREINRHKNVHEFLGLSGLRHWNKN